jgi:hypothetical protein
MPSISETGHKKNVSNFETMISFCTGYGAQYNPSNINIDLPHLNGKYTDGVNALAQVNTDEVPYKNARNTRRDLFDPFSPLCTKIMNAVEASNVTTEFKKDVKTIIRKLQGRRATKKVEDNPETPQDESLQSHSASQMSFDQRIENLDKLIDLLGSNPNYNPNEIEVKVVTLTTLRNNMITANTAVKNAYTPYSNSMIARDVVLYDDNTGLVRLAGDVKKYIKSVFGATSDQYRQVSALLFKKPSKK